MNEVIYDDKWQVVSDEMIIMKQNFFDMIMKLNAHFLKNCFEEHQGLNRRKCKNIAK